MIRPPTIPDFPMSIVKKQVGGQCASLIAGSLKLGFVGLTSKATEVAPGTVSCSSSTRLAINSKFNEVTPVTLPPGRLKLVTSLS
jgi:hypothetical protein